ncbi:VOC family protein [Oceanibacterium hippocampi]|uniref:VOC domain-containing protein n=1 Tax=Oceanibacterium hippocampi TaxID=745714 RepID=A0A1Y5U1L1_9PROT|nr:VOC family protein [Oceanibacterium hippocampi]SLN74597.1 hypothetical protein OCH7691_03780 [Oceanibacterium hippocampi]
MSRPTPAAPSRLAHGITGLDHVLIGVAGLEAARAVYERLGFTMTPRGRHTGWATANYCIMFENDYLELLGIVEAGGESNGLDRFLEARGEGLLGLALASGDAPATRQQLSAGGLAPSPLRDLSRKLELREGDVEPRFALVHLPAEEVPGLRLFIVQHLTPELMRRREWLVHANGARRVSAIVARHVAPASLAVAYVRLLGPDAVRHDDADELRLDLGGTTIRFLSPARAAADYPDAGGSDEALVGLEIDCGGPAAARDVLARNGVPHRDTATGIRVAPADACGVTLDFV